MSNMIDKITNLFNRTNNHSNLLQAIEFSQNGELGELGFSLFECEREKSSIDVEYYSRILTNPFNHSPSTVCKSISYDGELAGEIGGEKKSRSTFAVRERT
jgi:hypothetical protein